MIFLANDETRTLPQEFFRLNNLTVPSLRAHLTLFAPFCRISYYSRRRETTAVTIFPPKLRSYKRLKTIGVAERPFWLGSARSLLDELVLSRAESRQHYGGTSDCGAKRGSNPTHNPQPFCFFVGFPFRRYSNFQIQSTETVLVGVDIPLPYVCPCPSSDYTLSKSPYFRPLSESARITMPSSTRLNLNWLTISSIVFMLY